VALGAPTRFDPPVVAMPLSSDPEWTYSTAAGRARNEERWEELTGRPFLATAVARLGADADGTVMVGLDIETDMLAAQRQGTERNAGQDQQVPSPRTGPPAAPPAMSWTPSPIYLPRWANCHERRVRPGTGPGIM
jgi:hypothetical protein